MKMSENYLTESLSYKHQTYQNLSITKALLRELKNNVQG